MTVVVDVRSAVSSRPRGRWLSLAIPVGLFALTRVTAAVMLAVAGREQIALEPDWLHGTAQPGPHPGYWQLLANWDGQWYRAIAEHGYPDSLPRDDQGAVGQNEYAFFPLYPGLVRLVMGLSRLPFHPAAALVSLVAGAAAMVILFRTVERSSSRFGATMAVAALCSFPAAPVLQAAYTESLSLLLIVACLALLQARRYGPMLLVAVALALTRPIALALAGVVAVHWLVRWMRRDREPFAPREQTRCAAVVVATAATFGLWPAVVALRTGTWNAYLLTQQAWLVSDDSAWASWLGTLLRPGQRGAGIVALLAVVAVTALVLVPRARQWPLEWRAWAPVYLLFILAVAPPATSGVRYLMLMVVPWWPALPSRSDRLPRGFRLALLALVLILGVLLQWWWIRNFLVVRPQAYGYA
jgi:hypothetical protein